MFPKATKTQMVKFLRDRGFDVANPRKAKFTKYRDAFWLDYEDSSGDWHRAYYSAAAGRPIFSVDRNFISITLEEIVEHGMLRIKKRTN